MLKRPALPSSFLRSVGAPVSQCIFFEEVFPEGVILGLRFVETCLDSDIDLDWVARRVLVGPALVRYTSFYGRAAMAMRRSGTRPEALRRFKIDCGVVFVGCLVSMWGLTLVVS